MSCAISGVSEGVLVSEVIGAHGGVATVRGNPDLRFASVRLEGTGLERGLAVGKMHRLVEIHTEFA